MQDKIFIEWMMMDAVLLPCWHHCDAHEVQWAWPLLSGQASGRAVSLLMTVTSHLLTSMGSRGAVGLSEERE